MARKIIRQPNPSRDKLTPQQELFCRLYAGDKEFFANGTQAYMEAFDIPQNKYRSAMVCAHKLLRKVNILNRINEILELRGLNDAFVDKQLEFMVTQNADFKSKMVAIKEYNALKGRVTKKVDLTSQGDKLGYVLMPPENPPIKPK